MGWNSQVVIASQVIIEGTGDGLFVYMGTAGPGTLAASIASAAGTDPYGNTYPAGFALFGLPLQTFQSGVVTSHLDPSGYFQIQNPEGAVIGLMSHRQDAFLWYSDTGTATQGNLVFSVAAAAGTDTYGNPYPAGAFIAPSGELVAGNAIINTDGTFVYSGTPGVGNLITSNAPGSGTDDFGNIYLAGSVAYSGSAASELAGNSLVFYTGSLAGGWTQETWHTLSGPFNNGWDGTMNFQRVPVGGGLVSVDFHLIPGTVVDATTIWTLGANYTPVTSKRVTMGCDAIKVSAVAPSTFEMSCIRVDNGGVVSCFGVGTGATYLDGSGIYPLDI